MQALKYCLLSCFHSNRDIWIVQQSVSDFFLFIYFYQNELMEWSGVKKRNAISVQKKTESVLQTLRWLKNSSDDMRTPYETKIYGNILQNMIRHNTLYIFIYGKLVLIFFNILQYMHWPCMPIQYIKEYKIFINEDKNSITCSIYKVVSFIVYI